MLTADGGPTGPCFLRNHMQLMVDGRRRDISSSGIATYSKVPLLLLLNENTGKEKEREGREGSGGERRGREREEGRRGR